MNEALTFYPDPTPVPASGNGSGQAFMNLIGQFKYAPMLLFALGGIFVLDVQAQKSEVPVGMELSVQPDGSIVLCEEDVSALREKLETLKSLPGNWDEEGALPIEEAVVRHTDEILHLLREYSPRQWLLFPDTNGTLYMQYRSGKGGLSIGTDTFSFFVEEPGGEWAGDELEYNARNIKKVLAKIVEAP